MESSLPLVHRHFRDAGKNLSDPRLYDGETLPPEAVTSPAFANLEDAAVWTKTWVCVGTTHEIARPGDLLSFTVGNQGIHIEHVAGGRYVGRFNKAPHGGCRIVPLQCQTGTKTKCTFTSCGYSRDRGVMRVEDEVTTHQYLGLRPERLIPIQVKVHDDLIFVHLGDGQEHDFPVFDEFLSGIDKEKYRYSWNEFDANWKDIVPSFVGDNISTNRHTIFFSVVDWGIHSIKLAWAFPNCLVLTAGASVCICAIQPTALNKTLLRMSAFGPEFDWAGVILDRIQTGECERGDMAAFRRQALTRLIADFHGRGEMRNG